MINKFGNAASSKKSELLASVPGQRIPLGVVLGLSLGSTIEQI
jgi:hypothetical protein